MFACAVGLFIFPYTQYTATRQYVFCVFNEIVNAFDLNVLN